MASSTKAVALESPFLTDRLLRTASQSVHPEPDIRGLKRRLELLWHLEKNRAWFSPWLDHDDQSLLRDEIRRHPELLGLAVWPFVHAGWSMRRRFSALAEHLRLVDRFYPWLRLKGLDSRYLMGLEGIQAGLHLRLDWPLWFYREGGVTFNLFQDDHRLVAITFSFGLQNNELVAYVGGLQGSKREGAMEVYRDLTKTCHGLRPRDLVFRLFRKFVSALSIDVILCIDDQHRHHRHPYFGRQSDPKLFLSYDPIWTEHGGRQLSSGFFAMVGPPRRTPIDDVPTRKRAMYRRRYELLDALVLDLQTLVVNANRP